MNYIFLARLRSINFRVSRLSLIYILSFLLCFQFQSHANAPVAPEVLGDKIALVIGNAEYSSSPLVNPPNDARVMADTLRQSGVEVYLMLNADSERMRQGVAQLHKRSRVKTVNTTLFFYAGHGMQLDWRNFLIGVEARIGKPEDVPKFSLDLSEVVAVDAAAKTEERDHQMVVILDACRDNPFRQAINLPQKGLSQMDAPPNTLLAYSTAPGQLALDGEGENSVYTSMLVRELATPGVSLESALKRVRTGVRIASMGQQIPWESTSLESSVYLKSKPLIGKSLRIEDLDALIKEQFSEWERIKSAEDIPALAAFLQKYPEGPMNQLAQFKLDALLSKRIREDARLVAENQRRLDAEREAVEKKRLADESQRRKEAEQLAQRQKLDAERLAQELNRKVQQEKDRGDAEKVALLQRQETERIAQEQVKIAEETRKKRESEALALEMQRKEQDARQAQAAEQAAQRQRLENERLAIESRRASDELKKIQEAKALALQQGIDAERLASEQRRRAEEMRRQNEAELAALRKQQENEWAKAAEAAEAARQADKIKQASVINKDVKTSPVILALLQAAERINVKPILSATALNTLPAVNVLQVSSTPYFKGAEPFNRKYLVGDKYTYDVLNRLKNQASVQVLGVTKVDEARDQVEYNNGEFTTDLMGNATNTDRGQLSSPRQFYPANLQVGERWTSNFYQHRTSGNTQYFSYQVKVVAREKLTVAAGTFDTFRILATGTNVGQGHRIERTLWVTPGVNTNIATDVKTFSPTGVLEQHDWRALKTYQSDHRPVVAHASASQMH